MDIETSSDPTLLLPDYSTISDSNFTQMLLTLMPNIMNRNEFMELLNHKEILIFIRELTKLVNRFNYSQLQHEQWSYYYNLGMTEGIWNGRVSKKMADANSMCYTYGRSKNLIKQRLDKYKLQYKKAQEAINEHMKKAPISIDMQNLTTMINNLINKHQNQLRLELERRKTMLRLDTEEHRPVENIAAGEDKVRFYNKVAKKEKQKLITITDKLKKNNTNSDMFKQLMEAIEAREKHMIERADYITQQKLKSFFDEAPASHDTSINQAGVGANQN
ncbi:unnamed protein product [Rotaria sordida]|uniref:Uncharacterized protein n=2 Tax=Rotaria sordida TaxID=392033 RepID=A0A819F031_9BILA|nr:unnamed protein product [Rotaria sordida]